MTAPAPAVAGFLAAAAAAGLLHELDGRSYVADVYVDETSGRHQCLVEYADEGLLADPDALAVLSARVGERHPEADSVVLRAPGAQELAAPWARHLTYVCHDGAAGELPDGVIIAGAREHVEVRKWLVRALLAGGTEQGQEISADRAAAVADGLLDRSDRISFVHTLPDGGPIGHVTVLCEARDELSGRDFVELFDLLVEPGEWARTARRALETAAVRHAGRLGKPLLGHVVHPIDPVGRDRAAAVLGALSASGWQLDHAYWIRDGVGKGIVP